MQNEFVIASNQEKLHDGVISNYLYKYMAYYVTKNLKLYRKLCQNQIFDI